MQDINRAKRYMGTIDTFLSVFLQDKTPLKVNFIN